MLHDLSAPAADAGTGDDCVTAEPRAHPRVSAPVLALVRMRAVNCGRVEEAAALDDVSRGGFRVRLCLRPEPRARVYALLRLTAALGIEWGGPLVAVTGRVLRVEPEPDGGCVVAVAITRYRFFKLRFRVVS